MSGDSQLPKILAPEGPLTSAGTCILHSCAQTYRELFGFVLSFKASLVGCGVAQTRNSSTWEVQAGG